MPKLLQINVTANWGSTGKIAEQINQAAQLRGWDIYFAYGRNMIPAQSVLIHTGNLFQVYEHYAEHRLFDNDGLASRMATLRLINRIKRLKPNIIHLHNIHDHWLNYRLLFNFLNTVDIPIVWTQHDCWSFTGGCAHFTLKKCYQWRDGGCKQGCPMRKEMIMRRLFEKTSVHYALKKQLFTHTKNLTLVTASRWLENIEKESFLSNHNIVTIHNGINTSTFQPVDSTEVRKKYGIGKSRYVIGVSSVWLPYKGLYDFMQLPPMLPEGVKLVLVGLSREQMNMAQIKGIVGVERTDNILELAALYSGALMFLNLTYEDNYPTTNLEAMACGVPVLTYNTGGSSEALSVDTGWVVEQGDLSSVAAIVRDLVERESECPSEVMEMRQRCRKRAENEFDKNDRFSEYIKLYDDLLEGK